MIIAVSYKDNEIFEHFGHAEMFAIYKTNDDNTEILSKEIVEVKETVTRRLPILWTALMLTPLSSATSAFTQGRLLPHTALLHLPASAEIPTMPQSFSCTVSFPSFPTRAAAAAVAPAARAAAAITTTTMVTAAAAAAADATDNRVYKNSVSENSDTGVFIIFRLQFSSFRFRFEALPCGQTFRFSYKAPRASPARKQGRPSKQRSYPRRRRCACGGQL